MALKLNDNTLETDNTGNIAVQGEFFAPILEDMEAREKDGRLQQHGAIFLNEYLNRVLYNAGVQMSVYRSKFVKVRKRD